MRRIGRFLRRYKHFSTILVIGIVGLVLQLTGQHVIARWLLSAAAIVSCLPLLSDMWHDLHSGRYGIDILAVTAVVTSVILGEYWAALVIVIMLTGGEALEDYAEHRAKAELGSLLRRAPQQATVLRGRKTIRLAIKEVQTGDKLLLKPGEIMPVDAVILEGSSSFDESALTGESLPVDKTIGDEILSGSAVVDGALTVKALRTAKDSQFEQIIKLVRQAGNSQAPFVRLADQYSIPFTVVAYAIAGCAWIYSGDAIRFLQVIVVATPCPLLLAAPIAIISGMSRSSRQGIIVKTGGALERLARAKTIAFDKTGTLTLGKLSVSRVRGLAPYDDDDIVAMTAGLEQYSNHVVAQAIAAEAATRGLRPSKVKNVQETAGQGLLAAYGAKKLVLGRLNFLTTHGIVISKAETAKAPKQTVVYLAVDGRLAGVVTFTDTVRPESRQTVAALRQAGYRHIRMITGDTAANARSVAANVGIDDEHVTAGALPGDKLRALEQLSDRPVVFVGDGVNDAPVLTASDVGIALGARGSTVASEAADIVIMTDDVSRVATAAAIAKRTFGIARQSILTGIIISTGLMGLYASGRFSVLSGALIQELVDVIVIFNALRAHGPFRADRTETDTSGAKAAAL